MLVVMQFGYGPYVRHSTYIERDEGFERRYCFRGLVQCAEEDG